MNGVQVGLPDYYQTSCPTKDGCPANVCPDFIIKRHTTKPSYKVEVDTCDGALDLTDASLIAEVSIWSTAKLRKAITKTDTYFQVADNIGFDNVLIGDIIVMDRVRNPEHMLVTGFDESNFLIQVQRAYGATIASDWAKGTSMRIFREMNAAASIESVIGDIIQEDGSTLKDQLLETYLVYDWDAKDTCSPGCFWLEFKLLKMVLIETMESLSYNVISDISFTPSLTDFGCSLGEGVEWTRRFPVEGEGFLIKVVNSTTQD